MGLVAWLDGVSKRLSSASRIPAKTLLSPDDFQRAALCERMRVDRNGSILSVLVIELPPRLAAGDGIGRFSASIEQRLRLTDSAGRLHDGRFGILLPDTPESGAWKVAADLCEPYVPGSDRPRCEVVLYPNQEGGDSELAPIDDSDSGIPATRPSEAFFALKSSPLKRVIDIAGASTGLFLAMPTLLLAALAIKCTSRGPVMYWQEREGLGGKRFMMLKLRTMRPGAHEFQEELRHRSEQDGPAFKLANDPRVTWVGRWLRKLSIDELPQLWNVLRGEMSLVGPRPLPTAESLKCAAWQRRRLQVMPGLTCIWQIRGRNVVPFDEWIRMDLQYIRRRSPWYDLVLIAQTIPSLAFGKGPR
jgi:lipopolysaccharide/colanic/teichoic acid biosynthesis glycosyltransferase